MGAEAPIDHDSRWPVVSLAEIATKIGSGATPKGGAGAYLPSRERFAFVRSQNVFDRRFDHEGLAFITDEQAAGLRGVVLQPDDILLNITGDGITFGRACIVPKDVLPACVNQHVSIIRLDPQRADAGYVLAFLTHPNVKSYIESFNAGGSRRAITKGHIESFRLPLPPLSEQRAIALILSTLDDKIQQNRRMNETLEAMERALFKSWFVDFDPVRAKAEGHDPGSPKPLADLFPESFEGSELGEIPNGWKVGTLDQLVDSVLGGDWGSDEEDAERSAAAHCIRGADIPDLQIGGTGKMPVRFFKPSSLAKRRLYGGDLVIEISGGSPTQSTGRPVLVSRELLDRLYLPLVCSNFCRLLRLKSSVFSRFVYLWLRSLYANDELLQFENGTTGIKNLAFTLFSSSFRFCIPPSKVVEEFDLLITPLFKRQQASGAEGDTLAALRDTLLPKLVSGELRVEDVDNFTGEGS